MLQDSGLQQCCWIEDLVASVLIRNGGDHKLTEGLTPIKIWSGHKLSVKHLNILGSFAFVYVHQVNRNKLQSRTKFEILVGCALSTNLYRILNPKEDKVIDTIHVKIDETKTVLASIWKK
ncbi:uncharacterized protein CDAR_538331 [Caerostris darwini]|uniref:Retroviral polymerase SH3-like domain-containing protein n=1 Tax=Caerostris darwini TaxID=1538125 RepID=A0AAV4UCH9_9ARAC|nr:uncharacterized protein CDAR_538331 [Caerostris darwini]